MEQEAREAVSHDASPSLSNELSEALEAFVSRPADHPKLRALTRALKVASRNGDHAAAVLALRRAALPMLDFAQAQALCGIHRQLRDHSAGFGSEVRLAVLGSFTTSQLMEFVALYLFAAGLRPEVYEADYGVFRQEILDPASRVHAFRPEFAFLATTWRDLAHVPDLRADARTTLDLVQREVGEWRQLWERLHADLGCQIIQNNFAPPPWRLLANHEMVHPSSLTHYVARVNESLQESAPSYVTIHDVDGLAASSGRLAWGNDRYFLQAKLPCAPRYLTDYAHSVASIVAAHRGVTCKCLVLDLDNTLWGGVIGDDGVDHIRLGQGDAESEAFLAVQAYAKGLKQRGVLLAVCSANDERNARAAFERRTEMVLRLDDISCFVANWEDKATNIRRIAERLEIGLDSLVFMDDDPMQRALVRRLLPDVAVPELPEDASQFVSTLEAHRYFQTVALAADDLQRTSFYRANAERRQSLESSVDLDGFLARLEMKAKVRPIDTRNLERSTQLINKTNQFNLTTRRYSVADVMRMARSADWHTRVVTLRDRFGDNGLISVVLAQRVDDTLRIDTWLMSCRVLRRGVEKLLLNDIAAAARQLGVLRIRGEYIRTDKNHLVAGLYAELGFTRVREERDGHTTWELTVDSSWQPLPTFIETEDVDD